LNLQRRLEALERGCSSEPVTLTMPGRPHRNTPRRLHLLIAFGHLPRRQNADDGVTRSERQFHGAGRRTPSRTGTGDSEQPVGRRSDMRALVKRLSRLEARVGSARYLEQQCLAGLLSRAFIAMASRGAPQLVLFCTDSIIPPAPERGCSEYKPPLF